SSQITLTLWHQMGPSERSALLAEIARFEDLHPGVHVEEIYKETEELRSGFQAAVLAGVGPELVYGPADPVGPYHKMGIIQDLSVSFTAEELAEFEAAALIWIPSTKPPHRPELALIGDRLGNHLALVYNRKLLPEPPKTTSEMVRMAKALTVDRDGDGKIDQYGIVWNFTEPYFAVPFLTGFGGWLFQEGESRTPNLDTPQVADALQFIVDLSEKHRVIPRNCDYNSADSLFKSGQAAMLINGDWSWRDYLEDDRLDAAIAPLPVVDETGRPMGPMTAPKGYSLNAVAQGDRAKAAIEFIRYMTSAETQSRFLHTLRTLPSRKALYNDPILKTDPVLRASHEQLRNGRPTP
ncbi:MAG TPA: extracellular solute-binding protein, partial [Pirellulaceae bacterium]